MSDSALIFVVDDERPFREMIADYLSAAGGFTVSTFENAATLREGVVACRPDLAILDLNMPGEDGLSLLRWLRQMVPDLPVIMLTATSGPIDRVVGLELGADDYIGKPCELRELLARARTILRRAQAAKHAMPPPPPAQNPHEVRIGAHYLDLESRVLRSPDGGESLLLPSEFNLLKAFIDHPDRVLSRERLLDLASARDENAFDRAIDIRITRIRKKIERDPAKPEIIRTVRGAGYIFVSKSGA